MTKKWMIVAAMVLAGLGAAGLRMLTADEPQIRGQRVSPKLLKEAIAGKPTTTAKAAHHVGHTIQDLRALANDLAVAGHQAEANRVTAAIKDMIRRAEQQLDEKKAEATKLNEEIEELKWAIGL